MRITTAEFVKSATKPEQFPIYSHPEFAFIGRSNVGKSSLINMVCNRKNLVKTGSTPGMTRLVNFFLINNRISFVDLPGYGFANLPSAVKKQFMPMIKNYMEARENLCLVFLLIDIRREVGDFEREMVTYLTEQNIPIAITATKADKLTNKAIADSIRKIALALEISKDAIFVTSSQNKNGRDQLLNIISHYSHLEKKSS